MKKTKLIKFILVLIVFIFLSKVVCIFYNEPLTEEAIYTTPDEAIINTLNTTEYKMVESNGTFFAVCNTKVNTYNCQYIFNDNGGWRVVTDKMFDNAYYQHEAKDNKYSIFVREYADKYMISVIQDEYSINKNKLLLVEDSIKSKFKELEYTIIIKEHFWYICLDDIPKDYSITLVDQSGCSEVISIR